MVITSIKTQLQDVGSTAPVLGSEEEATELDMPEVKIIKFYLFKIKIY